MEKTIAELYRVLQRFVGLYRQLLETTRHEKEAIVGADLRGIQEATLAKESLVEAIQMLERERNRVQGQLALAWKRPLRELSMSEIIIAVQGKDPKVAEQLRSAQTALRILVERAAEANSENGRLVQKSLEHFQEMKRNVIGEQAPLNQTYTARGQKSGNSGSSRLLSKEI